MPFDGGNSAYPLATVRLTLAPFLRDLRASVVKVLFVGQFLCQREWVGAPDTKSSRGSFLRDLRASVVKVLFVGQFLCQR
ncbi:MAG: hypothetical protein ACLQVG_16100 [Terriglobia bacterium]